MGTKISTLQNQPSIDALVLCLALEHSIPNTKGLRYDILIDHVTDTRQMISQENS